MKTNSANISIIVTIYNVEKYLSKCIDSIIHQTYTNIEIILVDDASPDNCPAICDEYAEKDRRIKVIHKKNGGVSDARNVGLNNATGEYLMFVDGDDYIESGMVEKLYHTIINDDSDMVICNFESVNDQGITINKYSADIFNEQESHLIINEDEFWEIYSKYVSVYYVVLWNKIYKREVFRNICFPKGRIHEEEYVLHKIVKNCKKISCIRDKLYFYVQHSNSIMSKKMEIKNIKCLDGLGRRMEYFVNSRKYRFTEFAFKIGVWKLLKFNETHTKLNKLEKEIYQHYYRYWKRWAMRILFMKQQSLKTRFKMAVFLIFGMKAYKALGYLYVLFQREDYLCKKQRI